MADELDELERKISEAKASSEIAPPPQKNKAPPRNDKAGIQAGMEFAMAIGLATFFGYHIDGWFGTKPLFLILLFFLGVATGFWTLYKYSQKVR